MWPSVETDRVSLARVTEDDFEYLHLLYSNPEVAKTMGGARTEEEVRASLKKWLHHWDQYGYGVWILRDKMSGEFIGRAGLHHIHIDGADEVELLYALMPKFWGKGLATEVGTAIVEAAFSRLQLPSLICFTLHDNFASQRVMEKLGFSYEKEINYAKLPHVLYRLQLAT